MPNGVIASKASFLVRSMPRNFAIYIYIYIYIFIFFRSTHSVNVLNVSIYVYLNIRPMRYSAMQI